MHILTVKLTRGSNIILAGTAYDSQRVGLDFTGSGHVFLAAANQQTDGAAISGALTLMDFVISITIRKHRS